MPGSSLLCTHAQKVKSGECVHKSQCVDRLSASQQPNRIPLENVRFKNKGGKKQKNIQGHDDNIIAHQDS